MRDRLERIKNALMPDGSIFVHLDNSEMALFKVLLDEVFGRTNYLNTITMTTNDPSGFKTTGSTIFSTANYILVYAKEKNTKPSRRLFVEKPYDKAYSKVLRHKYQYFKMGMGEHW